LPTRHEPGRGAAPPATVSGAFWYLETCGTAVRVQQDRLLGVAGPTDSSVDLWLTLVALRNALRAVDLAIRVAPDPGPLRRVLEGFEGSQAAQEIRNVFEHFDEYFFGEGRLQKGQEKPHLLSPRISMTYGPGSMTVTVQAGGHDLEIPKATEAADDLLWEIRKLLREQLGLRPY
jgi:hypothetical protein